MFNIINSIVFLAILFYNLYVVAFYAKDYVYQFRRGILRCLSLQLMIALGVGFKFINAMNGGAFLDQLVASGLLVMAILSCITSFARGEGISEKGLFAFLAFTPWEKIEGYAWKKHFNDRNSYLILKLKHKDRNDQERYTVVRNEYKEEIDQHLRKYLRTPA